MTTIVPAETVADLVDTSTFARLTQPHSATDRALALVPPRQLPRHQADQA